VLKLQKNNSGAKRLTEFVFFFVVAIFIFAQYVIKSINHPYFTLSLTFV